MFTVSEVVRMSTKVLVAGDVEGNITTLFKRVETVNKKAGPFEMLLCVGSFFGPGNLGWADYKSGRCKVPLPVYILGPNSEAELVPYPDLAGCELAENVIYLGRQGCFTTKEGLRVAYLSGVQAEDLLGAKTFHHTHVNLQQLEANLKWDDPKYCGVDILLTSDWPRGVSNNAGQARSEAVDDLTVGSPLVSRLALLARPRYHFSAVQDEHYERPPYRNHQSGSEQSRHVTRFIALAKVGNSAKKKWLYAFNISPMSSLPRAELVNQPLGVTDMPFREEHITVETGDNKQQFRWDMNAKMDEHEKKRKRDGGDEGGRGPPKSSGPCWFCLSSKEVEKHLIVSVGTHCYLALPKGGLTPDHVLILPIGHHQNLVGLPEEVEAEVSKFKSALRKMYKRLGKATVFFERNYRTSHLQIQVVPVDKDLSTEVKKVFLDSAAQLEIDMNEIPSHVPLSQLAVQGQPYFYAETPGKEKLFGRVGKNFPLQFGREVLADKRLLDMEDRVDWKTCSTSKEKETEATKDFRKTFSQFDFTAE